MTEYHTDLKINKSTTVDDLVEFTRTQVQNPFRYNGTVVYNFSTHKINYPALKEGIDEKFNRELYQIPMQVLTAQAFIQSILPQIISEAEILQYRKDSQDYYAYTNFLRDAQREYQKKVQQEMAEIVRNND